MTVPTKAASAPFAMVVRYKVQCPGVIGEENRSPRDTQSDTPPERRIGTFLCYTQTKAEATASALRRLGYLPKLVRL